jgi:hypothetical protein
LISVHVERRGERRRHGEHGAELPAGGRAVLFGGLLQALLESEGVVKYTWPESVEIFENLPRPPSLKVVRRDVVKGILERSRVRT